MKCPSCITTDLVKAQREGFDIDTCPTCKGLWLEREELDKIVFKLHETDPSLHSDSANTAKNRSKEKENHSPILNGIENNRELYQLQKNGGKHHWMHRLFK